jgi:bifunctional enzyme CysN/CysC
MADSEILRFLTAGSVDDGKSTLIGRLLHDTNSIYQDQFSSLHASSRHNGFDFSLVTDGLRAEREQGITIDVAYRHFSTLTRRFIIADTPGHEQYTRNMATGASTASLAVVLMDARKGVLPQTHRHAAIAWLLGIRNLAVVVNKMDLVGFEEAAFCKIEDDFKEFVAKLGGTKVDFIPACAIDGDNVVQRSSRMPWFRGQTLLEHLESVPIASSPSPNRMRFPVQSIIRSADEGRRYAGQVASGVLRKGNPVQVLPSGHITRVTSIRVGSQEIDIAVAPFSVSIALENDVDISRGDMIADAVNPPSVSRRITSTLLWMSEQSLKTAHPYLIKHTTRQVCAMVVRVNAMLDPATLLRRPADTLALNEFGEVELETHQPLYYDPYAGNRATGGFIVIDPLANTTVGAGMIATASTPVELPAGVAAPNGLTVWVTGLSSAGKSTISKAVYEKLWAMGHKVEWLDGDVVRQHLSKGLGFSKEDRDENVRRIGFVAGLLTRNGVIALVSAISPYRSVRDELRQRIGDFVEVYVNAPLEVCEERDLKGIYRRARAGEMTGVTGVDDPYEPPLAAEVECRTDRETPAESVARVMKAVQSRLAQRPG